jgi:hypothetical protein
MAILALSVASRGVSAGGDRRILFGDGCQVAAHLLVLPGAEQLRYLVFDLASPLCWPRPWRGPCW